MASRGFDKSCLLQMQDAAFRFAAQLLINNKSGRLEPGSSLWEIVDRRLGGNGLAHTDISPGHIAAYMSTKALVSQFAQRDAMFDLTALLAIEPSSGPPARSRKRWCARTLGDLKRECDRISATTPMFASEISNLIGRFIGDEGLMQEMRTWPDSSFEVTADESETGERDGPTHC